MSKETNKNTPVKDAAGLALTAYIGVKAFQGVASATTSAICFVRARKANKTEA